MRPRAALAGVLLAAACSGGGAGGAKVTTRELSQTAGPNVFAMAWVNDDELIVQRDNDNERPSAGTAIVRVNPNTNAPPVPLAFDDRDGHCQLHLVGTRGDGRVVLERLCGDGVFDLVEGDPAHPESALEELAPLTTTSTGDPAAAGSVSWKAGQSEGLLNTGGVCAGVGAVSSSGVRPLEQRITVDGVSWRLGDAIGSGGSCSNTALVAGPLESPTGEKLAMFVFPKTVGVSGPDRWGVPGSLVVTDRDFQSLTRIVDDVSWDTSLAWAADGRIVFSGKVHGEAGLWRVDVGSHELVRLSALYGVSAVAPDGRCVAAAPSSSGVEQSAVSIVCSAAD